MKKSTIIVLSVFLGLLLVAVLIHVWPQSKGLPPLEIKGFAVGEKVEKLETEGPIDRIDVTIGNEQVTIKREDKERLSMSKPKGARADKYKVRQILEPFKDGLRSVVGTKIEGQDLKAFGLDDKTRVVLKLYQGETLFTAVEIGSVQKPVGEYGEGDTFIRLVDSPIAYRVIGKDLRRPFEEGIKGLREKKVFDFETDYVSKVVIKNPKAEEVESREIVLAAVEKPASEQKTEGKEQGGEGEKEKKKEKDWRIEKPEGYKAGDIRSFVSSIAHIWAQEYVDSLPEGVSIGGESVRVELTLDDGRHVGFRVSEVKDDNAYLKVDEVDGFAKISKWTRESIVKGVGDLRDKKVFGVRQEDIQSVRLTHNGKTIAIVRSEKGYKATEPANLPLGKSQVEALFRDIEQFQVAKFLSAQAVKQGGTGLDNPVTTVTVTTKDGGTKTLRIGKEVEGEKGNFYASVSGYPDIMTVQSWMADRFKKEPKDFRNKVVFDFSAQDIAEIEVVHKDETLKLVKMTNAEGKEVFKALSPKETTDLKEDKVQSMTSSLANLSVKSFADDKKPGIAGKPETVVTVRTKDGAVHRLKIASEKKDGDPYAETDTERDFKGTVFLLNQYQVRNFVKHLADLQ
jgi:hypothetical protein